MALYCTEEAERRQHLPDRPEARLPAAYWDEQWGREASRVDDPFREIGPVLTGQAPSLQLMGSGEATHLVLQGPSEYRSSRTAGKGFTPLFK